MTGQQNGCTDQFMIMVDELVAFADYDPSLKEGIVWLDKTEIYGKDLSFYEKVKACMQKYDANEKAKDWFSTKLKEGTA